MCTTRWSIASFGEVAPIVSLYQVDRMVCEKLDRRTEVSSIPTALSPGRAGTMTCSSRWPRLASVERHRWTLCKTKNDIIHLRHRTRRCRGDEEGSIGSPCLGMTVRGNLVAGAATVVLCAPIKRRTVRLAQCVFPSEVWILKEECGLLSILMVTSYHRPMQI